MCRLEYVVVNLGGLDEGVVSCVGRTEGEVCGVYACMRVCVVVGTVSYSMGLLIGEDGVSV